MRRREVITILGGAAAAWPFGARAQQAKMPTVGILVLGSPPPEPFLKDLREGLMAIGYTEGRNIRLEVRTAEGRPELLAVKAGELVDLKVDVIVTFQTPPAVAARKATAELPIVMVRAGDPVASGLIASFARPGGNVTGTSAGVAETVGKLVEMVREMLPAARRIALIANDADPFSKLFLASIGAAASALKLDVEPVWIHPPQPLEPVFETLATTNIDAVLLTGAILPLEETLRSETFKLAVRHRLPIFSATPEWPRLGSLASYSAKFDTLHRETATYSDKILKGSKPADLAVSFPTKFEMVINLKTAKALGLTVPPLLLAQADEVIE